MLKSHRWKRSRKNSFFCSCACFSETEKSSKSSATLHFTLQGRIADTVYIYELQTGNTFK